MTFTLETPEQLRPQFLLDESVIFLNHGSFGACPRPVFADYQAWQLRLERQPVLFLGREYDTLMAEAMVPLAEYVNASPEDLIYVTNATAGVNIVAKSLQLQAGDEVLTTDHEYGACTYAWQHELAKVGAVYVEHPIPYPLTTHDDFIEAFWAGVTPRTKVIYLSHITSPTGLTFPVKAICERAREAGIITVIDGAHAPGHIPVDLKAIDADFYTGNLHKWLCAPKGAAFLYVRPEFQPQMIPLWISWGYLPGSSYVQRMQLQGTRDPASFLTVPSALRFQAEHHWGGIRERSHQLVKEARQRILDIWGLTPITPESVDWFYQMAAMPLPADTNADLLKATLYDRYHIEIPIVVWQDKKFIRISIQGYNNHQDVDALVNALQELTREESIFG